MTAPVYEQVAFGEARGRWVLLAAVLGSGVALLDPTVVNIALPTPGRDLGADFAALQWTVNGYTLTLAALILLGGSLGYRYGRRQVFVVVVAWFAVAGRPHADRRPDAAGGRRHARTWHALLSLTDQCRWMNPKGSAAGQRARQWGARSTRPVRVLVSSWYGTHPRPLSTSYSPSQTWY